MNLAVRLSVFCVGLGELVHPLVREPQKTSGIARTHLQLSGSEYPDRMSSRAGGASVLFVGLLSKYRVGPNRLRRRSRQPDVVHDGGLARIADEQLQRLSD